MRLTPKEQEKLMLHLAGSLAKERRARGPEAELSGGRGLYQFRADGDGPGRQDGNGADESWRRIVDKGRCDGRRPPIW